MLAGSYQAVGGKVGEATSLVEEIMKLLRENKFETDVTELQETLSDIFAFPYILPIYETVKGFILRSRSQDLPPTVAEGWRVYVDQLDTSFCALCTIVAMGTPYSNIAELADTALRDGKVPELMAGKFDKDYVEMRAPLAEFGFPALKKDFVFSADTMQAAVSLTLLGYRDSPLILMRSALESAFKGMLCQHLDKRRYRAEVERSNLWKKEGRIEKKDSVVVFLNKIQRCGREIRNRGRRKGKDFRFTFEHVLDTHELYKIRNPKTKDVLTWLEKWNVFYPYQISQTITPMIDAISRKVHGRSLLGVDQSGLLIDEVVKSYEGDPHGYLGMAGYFLDNILLGTLNTLSNLAPKGSFRNLNRIGKFPEWKEFVSCVQEGLLPGTSHRLRELCE